MQPRYKCPTCYCNLQLFLNKLLFIKTCIPTIKEEISKSNIKTYFLLFIQANNVESSCDFVEKVG